MIDLSAREMGIGKGPRMKVNIGEMARERLYLSLTVTGAKRFALRVRVMAFLIHLAAQIGGVTIALSVEEVRDD